MMNSTDAAAVRLEVPADPRFLTLVRLAAAGMAAQTGLTVEEVDDLKIAVDEACAVLLQPADPAAVVEVSFQEEPHRIQVEAKREMSDGPDRIDDMVRTILEATTDEHEFVRANGVSSFRLTKLVGSV